MAVTKKVPTKKSPAPKKARIPGHITKQRLAVAMQDVDIKLTGDPIPLDREPSRAGLGGLREFKILGTHLSLLAMEDPQEIPTLEQRRMMANRLISVGPFLPRYVSGVSLRPGGIVKEEPSRGRPTPQELKDITKQFGLDDPRHQPKASDDRQGTVKSIRDAATKAVKAVKSTTSITDGVPLKKVCAAANIDPKIARRILRSKGQKPGGRWEWSKEEAPKIEEILKAEYEKLKKAGKV